VNVAINFERREEVVEPFKDLLKLLAKLGVAAGILLTILNLLGL
jgi:hypothetical protein